MLTLILLTHNNQKELTENFSWLKGSKIITEIVAVDDNSTTSPELTIKRLLNPNQKLKFFKRNLDTFSNQRNFLVQKSSNDWILWLDPDESVSKDFVQKIDNFKPQIGQVYSLTRNEIFLGKKLNWGETRNIQKVRIFNKKNGSFFGQVHEKWKTNDNVVQSNLFINHHSNHTVNEFFAKINMYSSLRAEELYQNKTKVSCFDIFAYPFANFVKIYFLKLGFFDGVAGCIFAFGMSFHSFLVRSKLWHKWQSP